tara:strand:+ start:1471 stop:1647 length:177 start_codon:yes stop_codon:yes gene_type:complete
MRRGRGKEQERKRTRKGKRRAYKRKEKGRGEELSQTLQEKESRFGTMKEGRSSASCPH